MHAASGRQGDFWSGLEQLEDCRNPTLRWILHGFDEHFEHKLHELKTTWNHKIRAFYRDVLSLTTKHAPLQVIYKLDDNGAFIKLVEDQYPALDFAEFVALRRYLSEVDRVEAFYVDLAAQAALFESKEYAHRRLKAYDLASIVTTLFHFYRRSPDADIFGRYYLKNRSIEIYVVPCIVFSMLIEEDFQDMAIGTLAHELAHGFHHAGADKDGVSWKTFASVEPALVEGLAEYYTRSFVRTVVASRPNALRTFEKASRYLPETYRRYERWPEGLGLETVYQAFIETRRNDIRTFATFEQRLDQAGSRLKACK